MSASIDLPLNVDVRPWEIVGEQLRVGTRMVPLADVRAHSWSVIGERDRDGHWLLLAVFGVLAWLFLFGVFEIGWRTRFLVGAGLAALILATALEDIWRSRRIEMHEIDIRLASGDRLVFSTGSAAEAGALVAALGRGA